VNVLPSVSADAYHADQVTDGPTLSKSIIQILLNASPAHARHAHPRLNPDFERKEESKFDVGTAVHQVFLEGVDAVAVLPYKDFKSNAAKDERDEARADGRIPLLVKDYERVEEMVVALKAQVAVHPEGPFFANGTAEETLVWEDDYGVMCRARLDWLLDDRTACHDLKTTKASASHDSWSRTALSIGADIQAAWYGRGMRAALGCDPEFRFIVAEVTPPYAISVFAVARDTLALAEKKIDYALKTWAKCLRNDEWPAYPSEIAYVTTPAWAEAAWLERELREVAA